MKYILIILLLVISKYGQTQIQLTYIGTDMTCTKSIGDEWVFQTKINNEIIVKNQTIRVASDILIESMAIEDDPSQDDVGYSRDTVTLQALNGLKNDTYIQKVHVTESYGDGAGGVCLIDFVFKVL